MTTAPPWAPLLDGRHRDEALAVAGEIAGALAAGPVPEHPGLAGGAAGLALLHAEVAALDLDGAAASRRAAAICLDRAVDAVAATTLPANLYSGFTGVAFALAQVDGDGDAVDDIDAVLLDLVGRPHWREPLDLVSGLSGLGLYALTRLPRPPARAILEQVVLHLAAAADRTAGVTWWTAPAHLPGYQTERYPHGYRDLGVAHGVPGIAFVLAHAEAAGVAGARELLDGALRWLLAERRREPGRPAFAPLAPPTARRDDSRLAWCYGDAGVAAVLASVAAVAGRPGLAAAAREVAADAAIRAPDRCGAVDAGICHGTGGLALLFARLWQLTGEPSCAAAARAWVDRTLALRRPGRGVAGYLAHVPRASGIDDWAAERGLLTGAAGVGLVLLALATDRAPRWDAVLAASPLEVAA